MLYHSKVVTGVVTVAAMKSIRLTHTFVKTVTRPGRYGDGRGRHHLARRTDQVYAVQAASEKITRLANETITMLREKREKVQKEDGSIAARNIIARLGKGELRTDAALREQVLDVLVVHRHLIPTARRGHYMMMVPHD